MADIDWPDDLVPTGISYFIQPHTGRSESPFTRQPKTYELTAPRWICRMQFRGGSGSQTWGNAEQARYGPRLDALLAKLRGGANLARIYDFRRTELEGDNAAVDLGNLAAVAGATQITATGADAGSIIAREGDYVGGDGRAHLVTEDATADAAGQGKVRFWPPLYDDIAVDAAEWGEVRSRFRLISDDAGDNSTMAGELTGYSLDFVEDYWSEPDVEYPHLIPTAAAPVKARKIEMELDGDTEELLLIRTRSSSLAGSGSVYFDEYVYRNPNGYVGVADGWQLWNHWTYAKGRYWKWLSGAEVIGQHPTVEFALRFGLYDAANLAPPYASSGEGPDYAYSGFGHGRLIYVSGSIVLAGDVTNYHTPGNWDVGQELSGTALSFNFVYTAKAPDGDLMTLVDAATIELGFLFDDSGLREFGEATDLASGAVGWNDSYTLMMPVSHDDVDWFKPAGEDAISFTGSGADKGGWTTTTATEYQAYGANDQTIILSGELVYGQPVRRPDLSLAAWALNTFGRATTRDLADYPKGYVFAASSAETPPQVAWQFTGVYEWQNRRRGRYRANGPV